MLSDLSPGDKLSLKGKIFELQKTLQIIDIRNKQKEEFSYKPTLYNYDLPDRDNNVLDSINKAEIIRKQKKEMLRAAVLLQSEEGCTFAPVLVSKSRHAPKNDKRPVHLRLTERGKISNESIEQLRDRMGKYDTDGNRLFTPAINREKDSVPRSVNHSFTSAASGSSRPAFSAPSPTASVDGSVRSFNDVSNAAADEFLYQDARDREERCRMREREQQAQIESKAAASKINSASIVLLRRKADRDARAAFRLLVGKSGEENCEGYFLGIDDVQQFAYVELGGAGKWTEDALSRHTAMIWAMLDSQQTGRVSQRDFTSVATPFLLHNTPVNALQEVSTGIAAALSQATTEELSQLQSFLRRVVSRSQAPRAAQPTGTSFAPHIYQHSYKLASKREKKEREQIEQILASQRESKGDGDASVVSAAGSVGERAGTFERSNTRRNNAEDGDGDELPPPPPPSALDESHCSGKSDAANPVPLSRHDLMYARALIKEQNLQRKALEVAAREMQECTFHPKIIPAMPIHFPRPADGLADQGDGENQNLNQNLDESMRSESDLGSVTNGNGGPRSVKNESIHERLYGLKDKMRSAKLTEPSSRMIEEMQACTFAPHLKSSFYRKGEMSTAPPPPPTEKSQQGVQKSIQRMRRANDEKVRRAEEEDHERKREQLNQSYARSREVARQGVVPFRFVLGERHEQREITSPMKRTDPDLIVDVKLSAVKTGKISIWRGDDPFELASSFARIYSLDSKARDLLVNVIYQSMEQNGLLAPQGRDSMTDDRLEEEALRQGFPSDREMHLHMERGRERERDFRAEYDSNGGGAEGFGQSVGVSGTPEEEYQSGSSVSGSLEEGEGEQQSDISVDESLGSGSDGEGSDRDSENLTA